jgi:hypothetical protein
MQLAVRTIFLCTADMPLFRRFPILSLFLLLTGCGNANEQAIRALLDEANTCQRTEDCVSIGSKCPFGCHLFVHADYASEMRSMMDAYPSSCVYDCAQSFGAECRARRCEPIIAHPAATPTGGPCTTHSDCPLPTAYALRSACPFAPQCIESTCSIVCPIPDPFSRDGSWGSMRCVTDDQCDCSGYGGDDLLSCRCVEGACVAQVE